MISSGESASAKTYFEANGPPARLTLTRLMEQPAFERRIGYRRQLRADGTSELMDQAELDKLCVAGKNSILGDNAPACDALGT